MSKFTYIATDQFWLPTLDPTNINVGERFDPNLAQLRGVQLQTVRVRDGSQITAYSIAPGSRYNADDCVLVAIRERDSVFVAEQEHYVFARENWDKVYKIAKEREPAAEPQAR